MLKRASVDDFKAWLKQRKPQPSPAHQRPKVKKAKRSTYGNARNKFRQGKLDEMLAVVKRLGECTSLEAGKALNMEAHNAANRLRILREKGLVEIVCKVKKRPVWRAVDNPEHKPIYRGIKGVSLHDQVIAYFRTHESGSNLEIAQALGYEQASSVGTTTCRMMLEGELKAVEKKHPSNGRMYRVFRLAKLKEAA